MKREVEGKIWKGHLREEDEPKEMFSDADGRRSSDENRRQQARLQMNSDDGNGRSAFLSLFFASNE
jgi:hypothetical protein